MKFLRILQAVLTRNYWRPSWALECSKSLLYGNGGTHHNPLAALIYVKGASISARREAVDYLLDKFGTLEMHTILELLEAQGLLPPMDVKGDQRLFDGSYLFVRDRWIDEAIRELKRRGK